MLCRFQFSDVVYFRKFPTVDQHHPSIMSAREHTRARDRKDPKSLQISGRKHDMDVPNGTKNENRMLVEPSRPHQNIICNDNKSVQHSNTTKEYDVSIRRFMIREHESCEKTHIVFCHLNEMTRVNGVHENKMTNLHADLIVRKCCFCENVSN